ncbi:MAG TPA: DUF302 domain-containing protein [Prolixibacteraceae bacterium]|nr:DUF302 domain-containing protein [Prolixibacteraceae bacterium]
MASKIFRLGKQTLITFLFLALFITTYAQDGLLKVKSKQTVQQTADRLEKLIKQKGLTFFAKVDHTKNAKSVDMQLRPTVLVIFGNPKLGTPLMQCQQSFAIDLPQKALIYRDEQNQVWIAYNDQEYLANRHNIQNCEQELQKVKQALAKLMEEAVNPDSKK